jgi:predicted DCC family thiol-disulfide oxidoreductase YuxK
VGRTIQHAVDRWLFDEFSRDARSLAIARMIYALIVLVCALPRWLWIGAMPPSFFVPPLGLASFVSHPPAEPFFILLNAVAVISAVALVFGWCGTLASFTLAFVLGIGNSFGYGFGKIDHDVLLIVTPIAGALAGWSAEYSLDGARRDHNTAVEPVTTAWPLALLALVLALSMFVTGVEKLTGGWLDPSRLAFRSILVGSVYSETRANLLAALMLRVPAGWWWEPFDWAAVLECSFLVCIWRASWLRSILAVTCVFHLLNAAILNLSFPWNLPAYVMFFDWRGSALDRSVHSMGPMIRRITNAFYPLALGILLAVLYVTFGNPLSRAASGIGLEPSWLVPLPFIVVAAVLGIQWHLSESGWFVQRRPIASSVLEGAALSDRQHPLIVFDGVCGLCNTSVDFLLRHDRGRRLLFTPLQSETGVHLLRAAGLPDGFTESIVMVDGGFVYERSTAILRAIGRLGGMWRLASLLMFIPAVLRDLAYDVVAQHRYAWFGQRSTCRVPTAEERARFL